MAIEQGQQNDEQSQQSSIVQEEKVVTDKDSPDPVAPSAQSLGDRALHFLSTASNETLGACFVGLGACTYLILGRLGLILMGAVGGVVLHSTWDGGSGSSINLNSNSRELRRRHELGVDVISRALEWREGAKATQNDTEEHGDQSKVARNQAVVKDFSGFPPETASALDTFVDAFIRDYVRYWYSPVLPSDLTFPQAARQNLVNFIYSLSTHLGRRRPADTFLDFLVNSSSIVIVFLNELSSAIITSPTDTSEIAIKKYLNHNPESNLANIIDAESQQKKLTIVADDVLEHFLDRQTYHCEPARVFLTNILGDVVLGKIVQTCSKAEWINGWIIYLLEEGEPEILKSINAEIPPEDPSVAKKPEGASSNGASSNENPTSKQMEYRGHRKRLSKAEEAMEEAMEEAKRLTKLIAEEEERRKAEQFASGDGTDFHSPIRGSPQPTPRSSSPKPSVRQEGEKSTGTNSPLVGSLTPPSTSLPAAQPSPFTSFDQLGLAKPTALQSNPPSPIPKLEPPEVSKMTLHNAKISVFDDSTPGEKTTIRTKPTTDYLVQIEPMNSSHPGWMIARRYQDFEALHEILRRISVVSGVKSFTEQHGALPHWKGLTKASLRTELERYLRDALGYRQLAESEGMKRFLEKDQGLGPQSSPGSTSKAFPTSFENMGKGVLDVLTSAPKGAADGGKAVLGGITGAFGAVSSIGQKRSASRPTSQITPSTSSGHRVEHKRSSTDSASTSDARFSQEILNTQRYSLQSSRSTLNNIAESDVTSENSGDNTPSASVPDSLSSRSSFQERNSIDKRVSHQLITQSEMPTLSPNGHTEMNLPPLPTEIQDTFDMDQLRAGAVSPRGKSSTEINRPQPQGRAPSFEDEKTKTQQPLTEQETQVAVELFFAIINELYTLSSAWNIRKTLLTAAKTFLLRPGNPNLESIRVLLQASIIDSNISDTGLATHIRKMRENTLPTEEELASWPSELTDEEREIQRAKARKLLVERGMPQALTSVMGAAASGEALGRVFDCLQNEKIARGLIFGLLLQGVRAITQ